MEKTLTIDGVRVNFKSTASTPMRYKAQFASDFFGDLLKMAPMIKSMTDSDELEDMDYETLKSLDFTVFYNIIWVLAKTADNSIPEPMEWLDGFDEFPLMDIIPELQDLMMSSFGGSKKKVNHPAMGKANR